jgi:hypothetical protein
LQQPGGDFVGDQRGKREGVVGYLKVRSGRRNGQGVKGFEEGSNSGEVPLPVRSNGRRLKRNLTGGAHLSVVKEK